MIYAEYHLRSFMLVLVLNKSIPTAFDTCDLFWYAAGTMVWFERYYCIYRLWSANLL